MFCCTLLYVHFSIAIILMGKRELIALLNLSSWCLVMVERLFLTVPRGCLQFVIVVFPDHTHLLFLIEYQNKVNITIFLCQILQRHPCPCKLSSRYVPPQCSLRRLIDVYNAERNSEGGSSTRREFLLSDDTMWSE